MKNNQELLIDPTQSQPTQHHHILSYEEHLPEANVLEKEISILTETISDLMLALRLLP